MSVPDPAVTDWVPLWNLGAPSGLVMVEDKLLSANGDIDFQSIPATYKHLRLLASLRSAQATVGGVICRFNGDSGGNYDAPPTQNQTSFPLMGFLAGTDRTAGLHAALEMDIIDYAVISHWRAASWRSGWFDGTSTITHDVVGHWKNLAAAINRIQLIPAAGVFAAGSRATLYALTDVAASPPLAGAFSGVKATKSALQAVAGGFAVITFDGEAFDTDGYHDNVTNNSRLTAPVAGKYQIGAYGTLDTAQSTISWWYIRKNGSTYIAAQAVEGNGGTNSPTQASLGVLEDLGAGDYVELCCGQNNNQNIGAATRLWMQKVG